MQKQQQFRNPDSLEALVSMCPFKEEEAIEKSGVRVYSREFQEMLDSLESEDCDEEGGVGPAKKRRLSSDQVRALEKHFDVENKLDPERKLKLAEELCLQPRQVAIWFQNRRARWKTKRLEKDFRALKTNYDSLSFDFTALKQEKENLSLEIEELKEKLLRRSNDNKLCSEPSKSRDFKDNGLSESDSNGMLIEETDVVFDSQLQQLAQPPTASWFQLPDLSVIPAVKMEDHGLFDSDESCNIFSVDQAPTLHWYFPE